MTTSEQPPINYLCDSCGRDDVRLYTNVTGVINHMNRNYTPLSCKACLPRGVFYNYKQSPLWSLQNSFSDPATNTLYCPVIKTSETNMVLPGSYPHLGECTNARTGAPFDPETLKKWEDLDLD